MKEKYLRVTMPDGSRWDVPAGIVAKSKALHFSEDGDAEYIAEFEAAMKDDGDLIDWAENNMNWKDVSEVAVKAPSLPLEPADDYQEGWVNGPKEIVEREAGGGDRI